jgi:chromosome segregation ATPase
MNKTRLLIAGTAFFAAISLNAEAKLYKWVDKNGTTHYGETIPPEYAGRDTKQLDNGRITDRKETFDTDKKKSAKKDTAEDKAAKEARRRDEALLNSFTNEKEIDLSRDRSLLQVEARINSFQTLIKSAQSSLVDLHKEASARTKKGWEIPASLTDDIAAAEARISKLEVDLENSKKESEAVRARFEAEKIRFRELKGLSPSSTPSSTSSSTPLP